MVKDIHSLLRVAADAEMEGEPVPAAAGNDAEAFLIAGL